MLNSGQKQALNSTKGFTCVLAGAGTGKTFTITEIVKKLLDEGTKPGRILLLTFTRKAADEMRERIGNDSIPAMTYHSFCSKMLRCYGKHVGISQDFTLMSAGDAPAAISMACGSLPIDASHAVRIISRAANTGESYQEAAAYFRDSVSQQVMEKIARRYMAYKLSHQILDYDDLLTYTRTLFMTCEEVRAHVENQFDYILVDEYQDTNKIQADIVFSIRKNVHNLLVVGDDAQSIYKFRGADVGNILEFPKKTKGKIVTLTENYRSTQNVLDLSNAIMENHYNGNKKILHGLSSGTSPVLVHASDQTNEYEWIADDIASRINNGESFCVLGRFSSMFDGMEQALLSRGLSCIRRGGKGFTDTEAFQNFVAFFRFASNPHDILAETRLYRLVYGVGEARSLSIAEGQEDAPSEVLAIRSITQAMAASQSEAGNLALEGYHSVCKNLIDTTYAHRMEGKSEEEQMRLAMKKGDDYVRLDKNMDKLSSIPYSGNIRTFLDETIMEYMSMEDGQVILSTVHSAKGLEWDNVYIADVYNGTFPSWSNDPEDLRCFYVAMTRAKKRLVLVQPQEVMGKYGPYDTKRSDYLQGADDYIEERYI